MLTSESKTIYIGKALNLRKRLTQYFGNKHDGRYQLDLLIKDVAKIETIVTKNERDALILENQLIKREKPKYNIRLKDDKTYPYIRISKEAFPRIELSREMENPDYEYFGPYTIVSVANHLIDFISTRYQIRRCPGVPLKILDTPCLYDQIGQCSAPCVKKISEENYNEDLKEAKRILNGQTQQAIADAKQRMEQASEALDFENAAKHRDIWQALKNLGKHSTLEGGVHDKVDLFSFAIRHGQMLLVVLQIRSGKLWNKDIFQFQLISSWREPIESFLLDYYQHRDIPNIISFDEECDFLTCCADVLSERANKKIVIKQPKRGELKSWLSMARQNVRAELSCRELTGELDSKHGLELVKNECQLDQLPECGIAIDAAIFGTEEPVVAIIVFQNGRPAKKLYRKFIVKSNALGDIYYIEEAFTRWMKKFYETIQPNFFIIDGGEAQLNIAKSVLDAFHVDYGRRLISISKGDARKSGEEVLHFLSEPKKLDLAQVPHSMKYFTEMRDEAHRFSNQFNQQRLIQSRLSSPFKKIPGIGPKTENKLREKFPTIDHLKKATIEELHECNFLSKSQRKMVEVWIQTNRSPE